MRIIRLLFFACLFLPPFIQLSAQTTGKIAGSVKDKDTEEAIPFANVMIEGTTIGAAADVEGNYVILNVKPGVYSVTASVLGYQKVTISDVRVNVDFTTRLDFKLSTGTIDLPAIVVQGERNPLIRQDLTNPTVAITDENIKELPVDQISDVIKLQAGVVTGNDGTIHVRGGRSNEISFTLNGVSVNDPYGNTNSIELATNAVQEVSVSTGTFNAQYGNALSGVVNYVTKEGGDRISFGLRGYMGDYISSRKALFRDIENIDPINRGRMEATVGGPIPFLKDGKFYFSTVYENFQGFKNGVRLFNTTDSYLSRDNFLGTDSRSGRSTDPYYFNPYLNNSSGQRTGDGEIVPMDGFNSINFQGNLSYKITPLVKLKYETVYDKSTTDGRSGLRYSDNYRDYQFNPEGRGKTYDDALIQTAELVHTVNDNIFYTVKVSYSANSKEYYLYEDPLDSRYLPSLFRRQIGNTVYYSGGTDNYREFRETKTFGVKGDIVAQLYKIHEVKAGVELRVHDLEFEGYSVEIGKLNPDGSFNATLINNDLLYDSALVLARRIPYESQSIYTYYKRKPTQFSAYVQDKIELASTFILNAGLRYEYFDPSTDYNANLSQNLIDSLQGNLEAYNQESEISQTLSPRISISYPITDRGIIRLSYGHFYQIGSLSRLYRNPNYFVTNVGETPEFGNPNVRPQKSIQYEIGLQQQLTEDFKFDLTGFYKDVSNYIYDQTIYAANGRAYKLLTNLSYANSRGLTVTFYKRRSPGSLFSATLDYTFSISEGNRTEPEDELFYSEQSGKQTETFLVPLDFDRSHVINATAALTQPDDWNLGVVVNFQTGTPYLPSLPTQLVDIRYEQNSANQPINWRVDLKFEKFFTIGPLKYSLFLQVENLFDTENELLVYASSGRALSNVEQTLNAVEFSDLRRRINNAKVLGMQSTDYSLLPLEDNILNYYSKRPERVNRPREVRLGFSILFN